MRITTILTAALPLAASAQQLQIPLLDTLKGYAFTIQDKIDSKINSATRLGAATVASAAVTELTMSNWRDVLTHSGSATEGDATEAWMVYVTGGNKSCHGRCGRVDKAWDEAVVHLSTDPSAPHLALLDCDRQEVLCGGWATDVATIWLFLVPHPLPNQSRAPTPLTIHKLNLTDATSGDITTIHTRKTYLHEEPYEGAFHPFDGWVFKYGLMEPMAYVMWGMSLVPSWAFMIGLSFFSRSFVNKRMPQPGAPGNGAMGPQPPRAR